MVICDSLAPYAALLAVKSDVPCALLYTTLSDAHPALPSLSSPDLPRPDGTLSWKTKFHKRWGPFELRRFVERFMLTYVVPEREILGMFGLEDQFESILDFQHHQPRLVACPRTFDFPVDPLPDEFHIDPLVDTSRMDESFDWDGIDTDKVLLYASMGSQTWMMKDPERFYRALVETVGARDDVTMLLSAGDFADKPPLSGELPDNVVVRRWVPQMAVLQRAQVMLTHGGLNSVKECIWSGVPMLAFPVGRDQPGNAARVEYHRLGLRGDHEALSVHELHDMLDRVTTDPTYQRSVDRMRDEFHQATRRNEVVRIVQDLASEVR
jgi:MGT family glycosyltransferase